MGGGGSKTTTVKNDPLVDAPEWLLESIKGRIGSADELYAAAEGLIPGMSDPDSVAGIPPEWEEALGYIRGGSEGNQELLDYAKGALGRDYESDYTDEVVNTTLAGMERQAQREALARESANAAVGGTSNTRQAVADALAGQLTGMNMAEVEAKLRDEGFRFGVDSGFKDADLAMGIGGAELASGLQTGGAVGGIGSDIRDIEQEQMNAPKDALSWLGGMLQGTDPGASQYLGSTESETKPRPSTFSQILGAGSSILGGFLASDKNVKEEIVSMEHGLDALKGVKPATYKYKDDFKGHHHGKNRSAGLMAQDLEHIPGAVHEIGGVKHVDPYPVLATVVQAVKELDRRTA